MVARGREGVSYERGTPVQGSVPGDEREDLLPIVDRGRHMRVGVCLIGFGVDETGVGAYLIEVGVYLGFGVWGLFRVQGLFRGLFRVWGCTTGSPKNEPSMRSAAKTLPE